MNSTTAPVWHGEHRLEIGVGPSLIWLLFSDVPGWKRWNAGIERIDIFGPFAVGTEFRMTVPGQPPLTSRLIEVRPGEVFTDETWLGDLVVRVTHRIERRGPAACVVTYAVEAEGPDAADVGAAVSADFPDVLRGLAAAAHALARG